MQVATRHLAGKAAASGKAEKTLGWQNSHWRQRRNEWEGTGRVSPSPTCHHFLPHYQEGELWHGPHSWGRVPPTPSANSIHNWDAAERASANTAELPLLMVKLIQATMGSLRPISLSLWIAQGSQLWVRPLPGSRHVSGCMRVSFSVRALASPEFPQPKHNVIFLPIPQPLK